MQKKIVFMDLDGTIIDHSNDTVPESTKTAIKLLKKNGHDVVIATGRPPSLFFDMNELLGIDTYIATNGRYVKHKDKVLFHDYLNPETVKRFVKEMESLNIDVGFESEDNYVIHKKNNDVTDKFSNHFHIKSPNIIENYHLDHQILQMLMFTEDHDISDIKSRYPDLNFIISCQYGIDINAVGGMKEVGVKKVIEALGYEQADTIAFGDGHNDIGMIEYVNIGVAMGNACTPLKDVADIIADDVSNDGIYKTLKELKLI